MCRCRRKARRDSVYQGLSHRGGTNRCPALFVARLEVPATGDRRTVVRRNAVRELPAIGSIHCGADGGLTGSLREARGGAICRRSEELPPTGGEGFIRWFGAG